MAADYLLDYYISKILEQKDIPFYALLMALMRKADSNNIEKLKTAFPQIWDELQERYNAPGRFLDRDDVKEEDQEKVIANIFEVIRNTYKLGK